MDKESVVFVAGHTGLVGSAVVRRLREAGYRRILTRTRRELDLTDQGAVRSFFREREIGCVILAAAKVGGIIYNDRYQADFLYENLAISSNVIEASARSGVRKLIYLGSSCIYPKHAPQPIKEEYLLTGGLEPTNEGYALAKIAGLKLCEKFNVQYGKTFVSVMPTNLYGPGDNFHPEHSHVIPGMMRRFHEAKRDGSPAVVVWGTGSPRREFLHVDDFARALLAVAEAAEVPDLVNIGSGTDCTITELACTMAEVVGYKGRITYDASKPDGTPRKVLDVTRVTALGWKPLVTLEEGLRRTYEWAVGSGTLKH